MGEPRPAAEENELVAAARGDASGQGERSNGRRRNKDRLVHGVSLPTTALRSAAKRVKSDFRQAWIRWATLFISTHAPLPSITTSEPDPLQNV